MSLRFASLAACALALLASSSSVSPSTVSATAPDFCNNAAPSGYGGQCWQAPGWGHCGQPWMHGYCESACGTDPSHCKGAKPAAKNANNNANALNSKNKNTNTHTQNQATTSNNNINVGGGQGGYGGYPPMMPYGYPAYNPYAGGYAPQQGMPQGAPGGAQVSAGVGAQAQAGAPMDPSQAPPQDVAAAASASEDEDDLDELADADEADALEEAYLQELETESAPQASSAPAVDETTQIAQLQEENQHWRNVFAKLQEAINAIGQEAQQA